MAEHIPTVWTFPDGIVTELEVDALRSYANAIIDTTAPTPSMPKRDRTTAEMIRGFFMGIATESDDELAVGIAMGRKIRRNAGDEPLLAKFQMCARCERPARNPDADGVCIACRQAADTEEARDG